MDAILLTVTGISVALAAVMAALLARMLREERRRSDARVALLSELAEQPAAIGMAAAIEPVTAPQAVVEPPRRIAPERMIVEPPRRIVERARPTIEAEVPPRTKPSRRLVLDDFELRPGADHEVPAVHDLFDEKDEPSPWARRAAVIGSLAAMIAVVIIGWAALSQRQPDIPAAATPVTEAVVDAPLELLSLRHAQQDGMLTISGLVQNPRAGRDLSRVKATLFVFGPGGSFITSGRAPLDFTTLGPGDESPFVVRVPVTGEVARYRIGFRGDDDRVLAHVDRRPADAIAHK